MNLPVENCSKQRALYDLLESIAKEECALGCILEAECEKISRAMKMDELDIAKLLEVNDSATNMVHAVTNLELVLKDKLEMVMSSFRQAEEAV